MSVLYRVQSYAVVGINCVYLIMASRLFTWIISLFLGGLMVAKISVMVRHSDRLVEVSPPDTPPVHLHLHLPVSLPPGGVDSNEWIDVMPDDVIRKVRTIENVEEFENPAVISKQVLPVEFEDTQDESLAGLKVWSMDLKIGPIFAIKHMFSRFGVKIVDRSISPLCRVTGTCADVPHVAPSQWISLTEGARNVALQLFRSDPEFEEVDAFICVYPVSLCELYLSYNKTVIVVIDSRYELGRSDPFRWKNFNQRLKYLSDIGKSIITATSSYDVEYLRHFSGVGSVLLPYHCDYLQYYYNPIRPQYLVMTDRGQLFMERFLEEFYEANTNNTGADFPELRVLKPNETMDSMDVTQYQGVIYIPHQVSFLSFTEKYRMGIPLFVPTMDLLVFWHQRYKVMPERCVGASHAPDKTRSNIEGSPLPDPNDDVRSWTIGFWVEFADFYEWPHIQHFRTVENLVAKVSRLNSDKLKLISEKMNVYNDKVKEKVEEGWRAALDIVR